MFKRKKNPVSVLELKTQHRQLNVLRAEGFNVLNSTVHKTKKCQVQCIPESPTVILSLSQGICLPKGFFSWRARCSAAANRSSSTEVKEFVLIYTRWGSRQRSVTLLATLASSSILSAEEDPAPRQAQHCQGKRQAVQFCLLSFPETVTDLNDVQSYICKERWHPQVTHTCFLSHAAWATALRNG